MEQTLKFKAISSMEKCFYDDDFDKFPELSEISMLRNEKLSFQLAYRETAQLNKRFAVLKIDGALKDFISVKQTVCVPSVKPVEKLNDNYDDNYLRTTPGLYPDLIKALGYAGKVVVSVENLRTLWIDIELPENFSGGKYTTVFTLFNGEEAIAETKITINVIENCLPESFIPHTEWFYTDCLANYYNVEIFSDEHWRIIENFIKTAYDNGINTILTPVITPALDTYVGGERPTTQLVGITLEKGEYTFDFALVDRWIEMCRRIGIKYYEIPHFYTQWGANHAPKVVANVDGVEKRIFGWDTDSLSEEYTGFLDAFIPALIGHFKQKGLDKQMIFHVSDEPNLKQFDHYSKTANNVKKHLDGYTMIDAVSHVEVFERKILDTPVVIASNIHEFVEAGADKAWVYYCCVPTKGTTNRFMAMPGARTRILGVQMYKFNIKGFLHWGYNFYNCQYSYNTVNPYLDTTGDYFAPSGDCFLVYPGEKGIPEESIRLKLMRDAFQDIRALTLCEQLYGREYVLKLIDDGLEKPLTFTEYPKDAEYILNLREKVNSAISKKI